MSPVDDLAEDFSARLMWGRWAPRGGLEPPTHGLTVPRTYVLWFWPGLFRAVLSESRNIWCEPELPRAVQYGYTNGYS